MNDIDQYGDTDLIICDPDKCKSFLPQPNMYLKILQQNIRSINKNFDDLCVLLAGINIDCDILVLSECWLSCDSNINLPRLDGYKVFASTDYYNKNDGVVVYVKSIINFKVEEPILSEANCLLVKVNGDTVVVAIYRPCGFKNSTSFIQSLHLLLSSISNFSNIIIVGDININILDNDEQKADYLDVLTFHGLTPTYNNTTRNGSCLDHTVVKTKLQSKTLMFQTSITDHESILYCLKMKGNSNRNINKFTIKIKYDNLTDECGKIDFMEMFKAHDINSATDCFITQIQNLILNNSIKIKVPRNKITLKPWITVRLLTCIRTRDKMHKKIKKEPNNDILKITYKRYHHQPMVSPFWY